jgi:hypothetical protein
VKEKDLKHKLQQTFDFAIWKEILPLFFKNISYFSHPENLFTENDKVIDGKQIGTVQLDDGKQLAIFTVEVADSISIIRNRQGLREIAAQHIDQNIIHGALAFFYNKKQADYRFSFIAKEASIDLETGELIKGETKPKRYTYLLGSNEACTTPAKRMLVLADKKDKGEVNIKELKEVFSVSTLTKEFYKELFAWYEWTLSDEIGITFPKNTNIEEDDREGLETQIIRLITRVLFVWFIKQKDLVPNNLFDITELKKVLKDFEPESKSQGTFYNAILQNLFFATLNKAITERDFAKTQTIRDIKSLYRYTEMFSISENEILDLFKSIPFLNGGLFECLDKENMNGEKYFLDGFSRNDTKFANGNFKHRAFIPNCIFFDEHKGIIPLLESYNFTIEENSPEEVQVALDPELLGNVFENLLGAFNTETKDSARKQSGSFYTPREIVDFMVDESLSAYLNNKIPSLDFNEELSNEQKKEVYTALLNIKILDPACGSGAFPMGVLNGIITLLNKIGVAESLDMYKLKLHLIENCIYGVDLQPIAVQISKLRFFISLIVEQKEKNLQEDNYGVITLPNLETKFVVANTLLSIQKKQAQGNLFEDPKIETTKKEIISVRHEHFNAKSANSKKTLREKDATLRNKLVKLLEDNHEFAPEDAKQVAEWNPYDQNSSSPFFDAEWMFGVKDGFDMVIGNPPYVQLQKEGGRLAKMFENEGYKTFARTGDIYSLFYEKGVELLKPQGHLCFITSNKWMRAGYGENTRKHFAEKTNPILLIDFAGQKIFETATVDTNILLLCKEKNKQKTLACVVKENVLNNLSVFVRQQGTECDFSKKDSWIILSPIEQSIKQKIEAIGTPLKDWDINIYRGILTGYNEAFIIDGKTKDKLIAEDAKSAEIIRPILRGRDIKRYSYDFADLWLINTHNGIKEKGIKPINIDDYPAIKKHLDQFYSELEKRADQGTTPYNLRNCAYMEDFYKQKIMYSEIVREPQFYLDNEGKYFPEATSFILTGNHLDYLCDLLHSKAVTYFFKTFYAGGGLGESGYRYKKAFLELLPIPKPNSKDEFNDENLDAKGYQIYQLTEEEINFIERQ